MPKGDTFEVTGVVTEALPNAMFRVKVDLEAPETLRGQQILATLSGKMRLYRIRVMPGDQVKLEMTPYDLKLGRLVYRQK
ncbi:MAG: translation initiation factor IF-1 [Candidatus Chisholmbacteria bacterium]|nr:translation initiation factor IF-1 [Candidatus Chisholmbacteria bacterium]